MSFAVAGWKWNKSTGRARPVVRYVDKRAGEKTADVVDAVARLWDPYEFHVSAPKADARHLLRLRDASTKRAAATDPSRHEGVRN
jgi:hypothetical protein